MLYYSQNSAYFDLNAVEASPAVIDTIRIFNSVNVQFSFEGGHEFRIQNIELENDFIESLRTGGGMFSFHNVDIVTVTNVTVKDHCGIVFVLNYVLTQKFYNGTFTNVTVYVDHDGLLQSIIYSSRRPQDINRKNTAEPVSIFQDLYFDVTL